MFFDISLTDTNFLHDFSFVYITREITGITRDCEIKCLRAVRFGTVNCDWTPS